METENFGCTGYYVDSVGRNRKVIEEYIRNQIQEDIVAEQLTKME
jgi:putative transposase